MTMKKKKEKGCCHRAFVCLRQGRWEEEREEGRGGREVGGAKGDVDRDDDECPENGRVTETVAHR